MKVRLNRILEHESCKRASSETNLSRVMMFPWSYLSRLCSYKKYFQCYPELSNSKFLLIYIKLFERSSYSIYIHC